ncbi:MAG TPA: serine/threonine-protein kinase [Planctomycetota bacterium]|nr:serine/threonine-protein kinase [Planctomycetota bacterium]
MSQPKEQLERKFGELAVEFGYLSQDSLYQALRQQHRLEQQQGRHIPLGELLRNNGALTDRQSRRILGLQTGCQKLGQYRLVRKLGAGGMGSVYEARQEVLNRPVALKILAQHIAGNPLAVAQFNREAQLVAKLDHPNIVAGIDVGFDEGVHYFAMELVPGESLGQTLMGGKRMRLDRTLFILREVAEGLAHAHSRGVIHRDIKPGNILVYRDEESSADRPRVKITDLGLAQTRLLTAEDRRNSGWNMGTPHYFAPEQAQGEHTQDFRVDIYALGMTFYRLLTGREPFEGMPYYAIRDAHETATLVNPGDQAKSALPAGATLVLRRMTAKHSRDRYESYATLIADLTALMAGRPVSATMLPADAATIRMPLEVFKVRGSKRAGAQPLTPTPLARALTVPLLGAGPIHGASGNGHTHAHGGANGKAHLANLPSSFLERYREGLDPKLTARNVNPPVQIKVSNPLTPPLHLNGSTGAALTPRSNAKRNGRLNGSSGKRLAPGTSTNRPTKNSSSGSALIPHWLKHLLQDRDQAEREG